MRLKSYFSTSVESALVQARRELGEDAMLIDAKPAQSPGDYEVVFGVASPTEQGADATSHRRTATLSEEGVELKDGFTRLRRELDRMREEVARTGALSGVSASTFSDPLLSSLYLELIGRDFLPELAQELVLSASSTVERGGPTVLRARRLKEQLASVLRMKLPIGGKGALSQQPPVIAVVGPPGSGKTSTLVKLAVELGLKQRKRVHVLSLDNFRIAATEQLRSYCSILGVGFQPLATAAHLASAIEENRNNRLLLVDTPGLGAQETDLLAEIGSALRGSTIRVHLVLSAVGKAADLKSAASRFEVCGPSALVFTHVDETHLLGGALSLSITNQLPAPFLCAGQRIPEDLEEATPERLVELAWYVPEAPKIAGARRQAGGAAAGIG